MSWIKKILPKVNNRNTKSSIPEGLWNKCPKCEHVIYRPELKRNLFVCTNCNYHYRIGARTRLDIFLDPEDREELFTDVMPVDLLHFKDLRKYKDRLTQAQKDTQENDALLVIQGKVKNIPMVATAFDFNFMGGSMGSVVGEKFVGAVNTSIEKSLPLVCFSATGGARMQEALFSLMQMAKTSAALAKLSDARLPYVSVLIDPTMGGVSASLAMLGDIHIAEPGAQIGFAGKRVIAETVREKLPEGFQTSEFIFEKGAIDIIVNRSELRKTIANLMSIMTNK